MTLIPASKSYVKSDPEESFNVNDFLEKIDFYWNTLRKGSEETAEAVFLYPFYIDNEPVSNSEYSNFCYTTKKLPPAEFNKEFLNEHGKNPVLNISRQNAEDYAKWAGKELPILAEWEKVFRPVNQQFYIHKYRAIANNSDVEKLLILTVRNRSEDILEFIFDHAIGHLETIDEIDFDKLFQSLKIFNTTFDFSSVEKIISPVNELKKCVNWFVIIRLIVYSEYIGTFDKKKKGLRKYF